MISSMLEVIHLHGDWKQPEVLHSGLLLARPFSKAHSPTANTSCKVCTSKRMNENVRSESYGLYVKVYDRKCTIGKQVVSVYPRMSWKQYSEQIAIRVRSWI